MTTNLSLHHSLISNWVSELRNIDIQNDRQRFRRNLERIGEVAAYEISKGMPSEEVAITTPLGQHTSKILSQQPILATILRAGLPLHNGLLNYFDKADNSFISAYRKHNPDGRFEISLEYLSCPDIEGRILIISDPMLATGASLIKAVEALKELGSPKTIHIVCAIASIQGINAIETALGNEIHIWCADIDHQLTDKGYIMPGLGDAGDLAFGIKKQS